MLRDRLSHIYYKIHVCMFPQVATRDSKQYLQQLMIPESVMGVHRKGEVVLQVTIAQEKIHISFFEACFLILYFHVVSVYM